MSSTGSPGSLRSPRRESRHRVGRVAPKAPVKRAPLQIRTCDVLARAAMREKHNRSGCIGDVARLLLGEPNPRLSTRDQLRFGSNGSVAVEIAGPRAGTWFDHENEIGGGIWDLLRLKGGMDKFAATQWLRNKLGID